MSSALDEAQRFAGTGDLPAALSKAWSALDSAPGGLVEKRLVAEQLQQAPSRSS